MTTNSNTAVFLSKAEMDAEFPKLVKAARTLQERIQVSAQSAVKHVADHGDATYVNKLYSMLPSGIRRASLAQYFLMYGRVQLNDAEDKKDRPFVINKKAEADVPGAVANKWYDAKADKPLDEVFDIGAMFGKLMAKLEKAEASGIPVKGMTKGQIERLQGVLGGGVAADLQAGE